MTTCHCIGVRGGWGVHRQGRWPPSPAPLDTRPRAKAGGGRGAAMTAYRGGAAAKKGSKRLCVVHRVCVVTSSTAFAAFAAFAAFTACI